MQRQCCSSWNAKKQNQHHTHCPNRWATIPWHQHCKQLKFTKTSSPKKKNNKPSEFNSMKNYHEPSEFNSMNEHNSYTDQHTQDTVFIFSNVHCLPQRASNIRTCQHNKIHKQHSQRFYTLSHLLTLTKYFPPNPYNITTAFSGTNDHMTPYRCRLFF